MTAQAQGVQPLSGDIFGEQTDLYSGNTSFSITDIELPGNSALSVRLGRSLQVEDRKDTGYIGGFSDWDVDVPYIESTVDSNGWKVAPSGANAYNRCTSQAPPHFSNSFFIGTAWHGITINIPGSSHEKLLVSHTSTFSAPADGKSYPWTTLGNVRISCLASTKNGYPGEGFIALTPSGEKYYFDWVIERAAPKLVGPRVSYYAENILIRKRVFLLATRVEDRFGNWVNYTYSGDKLSQISANDGRTITLTYSGASVATASDGSRIWSYQYAAPSTTSEGGLSKVTLPDGTKWQYQKLGFLISGRRGDPDLLGADTWDPTCMEAEGAPMSPFKMVVTHPSNAIGEFSFTQNRQYRTNVPWLCRWVVPPGQRPMAGATSVQTLTAFNQSLYDELISRGVSISRATIAATSEVNIWEEGTTFEWQPGVDELLIPNYSDQLSLQTKKISGPGVPVRTTSYSYGEVDTFGFCGYGGDPQCAEVQVTPDTPIGSKWVTVTKPDGVKDRYRFGVQYGLTEGRLLQSQTLSPSNVVLNSQSNEYVSESEIASMPFSNKIGLTLEFYKPHEGAIRPIRKTTIAQDGVVFSKDINQFDSRARPIDLTRYSSLGFSKRELLSYSDNDTKWVLGQLASISDLSLVSGVLTEKNELLYSFDPTNALITSQQRFNQTVGNFGWNSDGSLSTIKDANDNTTTISNYKRGIPQRITYADTSFETASVNDYGWVTSTTDVRNNTTGFLYDAMGRLTTIAPPTGDTVAWNSTVIAFEKLATAGYGLPAGSWKQSISKGNYRKETYLDSLWRPVVTREYDNTNIAGTQRFTRQAYDIEGRVAFASYPGKGDLITQGIHTEYDALGRVTKVMQDSELGLLTSTTEYLSGFKTKTTNPRQFYTLTEYMAWDSPNTSLPMRIESAEDVLTEFTRDNFGKPLSVKRSSLSDSTISNSRIYAYDAQQRLCQRTEPESGTTVISYDPVGNMLWSAPGQTVASTTSCNQSAVPTQARIVRSYDKLDRLKTVDVPNSVNDLAYHYIAGGLLQSLSNGGSGASGVVWNYTYNKLGLPVTETLNFDNLTKVIHHRYNADGVEDQLTLPSALTIAYTPNALGQATQSGTFATNAKYRSNGAIAEFTYGNNVLHKQLLNLRGLPAERKDSFSGALLQQEIVAFDVSGNVLCMRDNTSGSGGHRDMQYDAQDRLVNTYAPNQWWVNASTGYDVLDNIRTSTVGNRKHTYIYDANQRLTKITKPLGNDPSPQNVNALMTCNNIALNEDIGTISPEGSGTIEPPNTGGTTTPPGSGGNPPGGGGCQFACGGGGQQQNAIGGSDGGEEFSQSSMMAMSSAGGGGDDIPGAPITVYQFTQDANGNTVSGRHAAVFDALNRVTEITGIEQYQYDGHGRRVKTKRLSDNKINYSVYDLSGRLLTEDDARTNKKTDYIHFNGRLVAERSAALTGTTAQTTTYVNSYLHTDSLGSPVAKTSQTGAITKIERYTPYGEPSDQTYDQGPGYTGHVTDSLTGLSYAQQRYYDPLIGRFLSVDPIETDPNTGASFNRYNYANNNPYKFTDPDGRDAAERFVEQHRADMQSGNGKIYEPFEKPVVIVTGTMLAATPLIGPIASLIFRQRITSEVKPLNGNSKNSPKEQHRYEISDKDGDVVKTGISGKALNKDGTSGRANVQVNSLNKTEGPGSYTATVKETGIPGRRAALEAEKAATKELKSEGNTLRLQQRPKPE